MCAINPFHKKRFIVDVYTSDPNMTKEQFDVHVIEIMMDKEQQLNSGATRFRFHVKATTEEAD